MNRFAERGGEGSRESGGAADRGARDPGRRTMTQDMVPRGGGAPLPSGLREELEPALGQSLGGVRVHTGAASASSAAALDARAFTVGQDVHFGAGEFAPESEAGRHLIAHEVAHTVQQAGSVAGPACAPLEVSTPGDPLEREAEAFASSFGSDAPHPVRRDGAATVARVMRTPTGESTPALAQTPGAGSEEGCLPSNAPPAEDAVREDLREIPTYLQHVAEQIALLQDVAREMLDQRASQDGFAGDAGRASARTEHSIAESERFSFGDMIEIVVALAEIGTGLGGVILAAKTATGAKRMIDTIKGVNDNIKGGRRIDKAGRGSGGVDRALFAQIEVAFGRLGELGAGLTRLSVMLGKKTQSDLGLSLKLALGKLESVARAMDTAAACGVDYSPELRAYADERLGEASTQVVTLGRELTSARALLGAGDKLPGHQLQQGTPTRGLIEFLAERVRCGQLGQFRLRKPRSEWDLHHFEWREVPGGVVSRFQSNTALTPYGCRIDGGALWWPMLVAFGAPGHNPKNPEHPHEVGIETWVWDSIKSTFSAIGLETDNDSRINVSLPGNQPSPQYRAANTSEFYAGPEFRALYQGPLQPPGRLVAIEEVFGHSSYPVAAPWLPK